MKNVRQNNIEIRKTNYKEFPYEFIKWYPNEYFGKEKEYIKDGWEYSFGGDFLKNGSCNIDINFFRGNPESCYVIAWFIKGKEEWYIQSVGERLLDLSEEELKTFFNIYKTANKKLNK